MYKLSKATCLRIRNDDRLHIDQDKRIVQDQTSSIISAVAKELIIKIFITTTEANQNKRSERISIRKFWQRPKLSHHTEVHSSRASI